MTKRLTGPLQEVTDQRDALDFLEGLPAPPEHIGDEIAHLVPPEYYPGAFGWTAHVSEVADLEDGTGFIDLEQELIDAHDGAVVDLGDGRVVTIDLSAAVEL